MLDEILKEICKALLEADVNVKLVASLRTNIKAAVAIDKQPAGINKRKLVHKVMHPFRILMAGCLRGAVPAIGPRCGSLQAD